MRTSFRVLFAIRRLSQVVGLHMCTWTRRGERVEKEGFTSVKRLALAGLSMMAVLGPQAGQSTAQAIEPAGVVTEIHLREGQVEVKRANLPGWRPAGPLLMVEAGDTVRTTRDASVVILLTGNRGTVKVDGTNSPFVVPAMGPLADQSKLSRGRVLLEESVKTFLKVSTDSGQTTLGTRGHARPTVILTPHNGPVLPDPVVFEWLGSRTSRYTIRVIGPTGLVLERKDLVGTDFTYPPEAVPLVPGVRYLVQVTTEGQPPQVVWFEVVDPVRAETIRQDLAELAALDEPALSPNTLVAVQAAYLANQGLLADSRLTLIRAVNNQPDEAILHALLGYIYERLGLPEQAAESFHRAQFVERHSIQP